MLLEVKNLKKFYPETSNPPHSKTNGYKSAVDGISFTLDKGKTLSLVGESGCGKTTTGKLVLRLIEPTSGKILFKGSSLMELTKGEMRAKRKEMQIIFQDPYGSLNPRMTVSDIIGETFEIHEKKSKHERREAAAELLNKVGLSSSYLDHYAHEFSGGQRQRICIARAIALKPEFIVCDEPISSLDVSIKTQIINLLENLQEDYGISYLFIAHDLAIVKRLSDHVAVMFKGKIVEKAKTDELYNNPLHPYTISLLFAVPIPDPELKRKRNYATFNEITNQTETDGCKYYNRCNKADHICKLKTPDPVEVETDHFVSCHKQLTTP